MKERPILFNGAMVRAVLAGDKTQTRRLLKPPPQMVADKITKPWEGDASALLHLLSQSGKRHPYGSPGDRLWVRETWAHGIHAMAAKRDKDGPFVYAATDRVDQRLGECWKPSIHMPRAASRITLEVTGVRVERLQEISYADAIAEGIEKTPHGFWSLYGQADTDGTYSPRSSFRALWESINGPGSWDANPWLWAVEFKRVAQGEAQ